MRAFLPFLVLTSALAGTPAVSPAELMPFLKVIAASAGAPGRIACKDMDLSMQMKKSGLSPDAKSPLAWAANEDQLRGYLAEGKLVVVGDLALISSGAAIAVVREKGKPGIVVQPKHVASSGLTLSDALLKIARIL